MKKTIVISAYPGCGKSYFYNNHDESITVLDSDSIWFSWIYDENGNKTDERNPDFPNNYIRHIKENIGVADVIFTSSHDIVRDALKENNIKFALIFPSLEIKDDWMQRLIDRGSNEAFVNYQRLHYEEFINDMKIKFGPSFYVELVNKNSIIDNNLILELKKEWDFIGITYRLHV